MKVIKNFIFKLGLYFILVFSISFYTQGQEDLFYVYPVYSSQTHNIEGEIRHISMSPTNPNVISFESFETRGTNNLWWMDVITGEVNKIKPFGSKDEYRVYRSEREIDWSPVEFYNKHWFLFVSRDEYGKDNLYIGNTSDEIYIKVTKSVYNDYEPRWSPDGKNIVYVSTRTGEGDLYLIKKVDSIIQRYERWLRNLHRQEPSVIKDENKIFDYSHNENKHIRLTNTPVSVSNPDWSPDGRFIVYLSLVENITDTIGLFLIDTQNISARPINILGYRMYDAVYPQWSYDQQHIAYYLLPIDRTQTHPNYNLAYLMIQFEKNRLVSRAQVEVVDRNIRETRSGPVWLLNSLVYIQQSNGSSNLVVRETSSRNPRNVTLLKKSDNKNIQEISVVSFNNKYRIAIITIENDNYFIYIGSIPENIFDYKEHSIVIKERDDFIKELPIVSLPPRLSTEQLTFTDTDGDNRLSAGEQAVISFSIINTGQGPANDVKVSGITDAPISGLQANVGTLEPGETRSIALTITGGSTIQDGRASITINISEAGGFEPPPLNITLPTRAYRPPQLTIADVAVSDELGRGIISPGEIVTVTVRIFNNGENIAEDVKFSVTAGENVFISGRERGTFTEHIGDIKPGAFKDVSFESFCNTRAEVFPLIVAIEEKEGKYGIRNQELGLQLETRQRTPPELIIVAEESREGDEPALPLLTSSIERNIPVAGKENPEAIAVILGNKNYRGDTPDVAFAFEDARLVRRYVEQAFGYRPGRILYKEDATLTDFRVLFGDERSPRGRVSNMVRRGRSDVFIFYSGHGAPDPDTNTGYLMPVDADPNLLSLSGYSLNDLYTNLSQVGARSVTVVIDACFSGATRAGEMLIAQASPIGIEIRDPAVRIPNSVIITASSGSQIASWHPEKRHGLLTYFFLKGIQGAADLDGDERITVGELRRYLNDDIDGLPYYSRYFHGRDQTPQVWGEEGIVIR